ncbi:MAG: hypothetical protein ACLUUF_00580 [Bifidobacterium pullorum]
MWSITLKLMRKNARMLIPAGIAILIGTMFIASTLLFGNTLDYRCAGRSRRPTGMRITRSWPATTTRRYTASPSAT